MRAKTKIVTILLLIGLLAGSNVFAGTIYDEARYMARLADWAMDEKTRGHQNYLDCLLGKTPFEGRISGIKDNSAFVRGESARVLSEMGGVAEVPILAAAARDETDPQARELMYLSAVKLDFQSRATLAEKEEMVRNFLQKCFQAQENFGEKGIPEEALEFVIGKVEDNQMQSVSASLDSLQKEVFADNSAMQRRLAKAQERLSLFANKDTLDLAVLEGIYRQALGMNAVDISGINESLSEWAVYQLTRPDRDVEEANRYQQVANRLLVQLLNPAADKPRDVQVFQRHTGLQLKEAMDRNGILCNENFNATFEFSQGNLPAGWIFQPEAQAAYAASEVKPHSYNRCLAVLNPTVGSSLSIKSNQPVSFKGRLPRSLEMGLFYKMVQPRDAYLGVDESGLILWREEDEEDEEGVPQGKHNITLRVNITLRNFSNNTLTTVTEVVTPKQPYSFDKWEGLFGHYEAPVGTAITQASLEVVVEGKSEAVPIYLDDVYLRRGEEEFVHAAPQVTGVNVNPASILSGEVATLTADVETYRPVGSMVSGQWVSNIEGALGSSVERPTEPIPGSQNKSKAHLTIQQKFAKDGDHTLFFTAKDDFGLEGIATANIKVVKPIISLSARRTATAPEIPLYDTKTARYFLQSANLPLVVSVQGLGQLASSFRVTEYGLYLNDAALMTSSIGANFASVFSLDTCRLPNGINWIKAGVKLQRTGTTAVYSFYSDLLSFYVQNASNLSKAPKITTPKYDALVSAQVYASVSFDNPKAKPRYVNYQLLDAQNKVVYSWRATTPYSLRLDLARFQDGPYNLLAVACYYESGGVTIAYSDKVKITKDTAPPVIANISTNYAKSFANGLEIKADVSDAGAGVNNASVYYQRNYLSNGQYVWSAEAAKPMSLFASPATYKATLLSSEVSGSYAVKYYIKAWDKAGNCKVSATATLQ